MLAQTSALRIVQTLRMRARCAKVEGVTRTKGVCIADFEWAVAAYGDTALAPLAVRGAYCVAVLLHARNLAGELPYLHNEV